MTLTQNVQASEHPGRDVDVEPGLYLCDVSGSRLWRWNAVFRVMGLTAGGPVDVGIRSATPELLQLEAGSGMIEVTWGAVNTVRVRGSGVGVRLHETVVDPFGSAVALPTSPRSWRLQMGEDAHFAVDVLQGSIGVEAPMVRTGPDAGSAPKIVDIRPLAGGSFEFTVTLYRSGYVPPEHRSRFGEDVVEVAREFSEWRDAYPAVAAEREPTATVAAYVQWGALVRADGLLQREGMLMAKHWMNAIWSWDHCFNALGLARAHPSAAWDQFMVVLDAQNDQGALPDLIHDAGHMWGFVKPPVHGWALRLLLGHVSPPPAELAAAYQALARWTEWWLTYRDTDGDGLCEYFHGCDSGQDNSTAYDMGFPAVGPDLAAFLIVQMDVVAELALRFGDQAEAARWSDRADAMTERMLDRLWTGRRFQTVHAHSGRTADGSLSQTPFLPLVLGDRLPQDVRAAMIDDLRASGILTPFGPASESPASDLYEADGYWRGAIWPSTTFLIVDGLRVSGAPELSATVARSFVDNVERVGFAENYESTDGRALRCPAYTWSASAYWAFLGDYLKEPPAG